MNHYPRTYTSQIKVQTGDQRPGEQKIVPVAEVHRVVPVVEAQRVVPVVQPVVRLPVVQPAAPVVAARAAPAINQGDIEIVSVQVALPEGPRLPNRAIKLGEVIQAKGVRPLEGRFNYPVSARFNDARIIGPVHKDQSFTCQCFNESSKCICAEATY